MNAHFFPASRRWLFVIPLLAVFLFSSPASALLMRENGPEPIIVQIKESFRLSDDLDNRLSQLAAVHNQNGLTVVKWHAGEKLLVMLSFPSNFTEQHALAVIATLQHLPAVEKVVALSAANLEFKPADFVRQYASSQAMPEAARRGLDRDEASHPAMTQAQIDEAAQMPHRGRQLIVRWKSRHVWRATATGFLQSVAGFHASAGAHVVRERRQSDTDWTQVIEFDDPATSLPEKLRRYVNCPWVLYVQPNYTYSISSVTPNDLYYTNPGQPSLPKIKAPEAWSITTGSKDVVIAVADSGANIYHPDFVNRLSPGQRCFVPFYPPYDVTDDYFLVWHGSNVASIIGAEGNNGSVGGTNGGYMAGIAWDVSLLILKVVDQIGKGFSSDIADAIVYACGADGHAPATAINLSLAFPPSKSLDYALTDAIAVARKDNMVAVAAAGNGDEAGQGIDCDADNEHLINPASIPYDNVIAVGATRVRPDRPDLDDTKPMFSNYGKYRVELGAPGGEDYTGVEPDPGYVFGILGLTQLPDDPYYPPYNKLSGTSQATAHVTGAVALVKSKYPWEDYWGLRDRVIMGTDDVAALSPSGLTPFRTGGRLNLNKALQKRTLIRNFSTRAKVENGDRIVIGGFTIRHTSTPNSPAIGPSLKVAIRGIGPSLPPLSVARLNDPKLQLNDSSGNKIFSNDDWGNLDQAQKADLLAAGLTPANSHEAAMVQVLPPGSYTVFLESQDGQQGVGQFEIYELSGNTSERTRLRAVSTRCPVGVGDEVAVAGTIVGDANPNPDAPKRRLLMLGKSPLGVNGTLDNPQIELHGTNGLIDSNDDWSDFDGPSTGLEHKLSYNGIAPQFAEESALWPTLAQGSYTTVLSGVNNGTGIGLIEFYEY